MHYYLISVTHGTATKNALQKSVYDYLVTFDRILIEKDELPKLKKTINTVIAKHNAAFHRCTPLVPDWWSFERKQINDWHLGGINHILNFHVMECKPLEKLTVHS